MTPERRKAIAEAAARLNEILESGNEEQQSLVRWWNHSFEMYWKRWQVLHAANIICYGSDTEEIPVFFGDGVDPREATALFYWLLTETRCWKW
jgi:hypothetical protein